MSSKRARVALLSSSSSQARHSAPQRPCWKLRLGEICDLLAVGCLLGFLALLNKVLERCRRGAAVGTQRSFLHRALEPGLPCVPVPMFLKLAL